MLKKLIPYTRSCRGWIALGVLCSAAEAVFELIIPMVMADIVDVGIASGDTGYILRKGAVMVAMALVSLAFGLGSAVISSISGQRFGANLRSAEYAHIQEYAFSNIEKFSTASLITRLTNDVNAMQMTLMMGMRILVRAPVMLIAALLFSIRISAQLSRTFLVAIPLLAVFIGILLTRAGPMFRALQERTDALNLAVQEDLASIRVVKSFVREEHEAEKFAGRNGDLRRTSEHAFGTVVVNMPVMMLIIYGTIIAVLWFGGHMVAAGTLLVGSLTSLFTYVTQILISCMMVSMIMMMATRSVACARRICEVLDEVPAISNSGADPSVTPDSGSVDFDGVSFRYDPRSPALVLRNIDLHIRSGQTVGILGATGSAKTTLVSLIPRLYEATEGTVRVDGRDVRNYSLEHLRGAVSMVLQKNTLFSGTIRENLRWGAPDAPDEELWAACRAACADEFLEKLPDGLDTDLGQGGVNVSGGQKQRLCIARAILAKPKILILDDSTSAVDTATDAKIRSAFRTALPDATKLIIAQRIASVADADLIVVLDEGAIVETGTHESLMAAGGIYCDIYEKQQEGVSIHG